MSASSSRFSTSCYGRNKKSWGQLLLSSSWTKMIFFSILALATGWNSFPSNSTENFYTFQEFYTDAQYGPDFGYYSKGRILNGEWFNSYTTYPMALSPQFGKMLADRIHAVWIGMGKPKNFQTLEFGGGTGILARDILLHIRNEYPEFFETFHYTIGERSPALRRQQRKTIMNAGVEEFAFDTREADATKAASILRPHLEEASEGKEVIGAILSNELLDEFDPIKLKFVWPIHHAPTVREANECSSWREVNVVHLIDLPYLPDKRWQVESNAVACSYLDDPWIKSLIKRHFSHEQRCFPYAVCCVPFLLALSSTLELDHLFLRHDIIDAQENRASVKQNSYGNRDLSEGKINRSRHNKAVHQRLLSYLKNEYSRLAMSEQVLLTKKHYRELRRMYLHDHEAEERLLTDGYLHTIQIYLGLTKERCEELQPFFSRHASRFVRAAERRAAIDKVGPLHPHALTGYLKWVARPGEDLYAQETGGLIDKGVMITIDYGADFEALGWLQVLRPHYDGVHIMDARHGNKCTNKGELLCPGMTDMTTNVDFTNFAEASFEYSGFQIASYSSMVELERVFAFGAHEESIFPHLIERAGGLRGSGVYNWYKQVGSEPWAGFKALVSIKDGPVDLSKSIFFDPLKSTLFRGSEDTKQVGQKYFYPFTGMAYMPLVEPRDEIAHCMEDATLPALAGYLLRQAKVTLNSVEPWATAQILEPLQGQIIDEDSEGKRHMKIHEEYHLSIILLDYAVHLSNRECPINWNSEQIRLLAVNRRMADIYGLPMLDENLQYYAQLANATVTQPSYKSEFREVGCMLRQTVNAYCDTANAID